MNSENKTATYAKISMILGIIGLVVWFFPIIGLPVSTVGLTFGLRGFDAPKKWMAIAGIVLCVVGISFSSVNAGIGCYMGATGQHDFVNKLLGN